MTAALILGALGVGTADIATDYALSSELLGRGSVRFDRDSLSAGLGIPTHEVVRTMATVPETIHALFARIQAAHGSVPGFLRDLGVSETVLGDLRSALIGPGR